MKTKVNSKFCFSHSNFPAVTQSVFLSCFPLVLHTLGITSVKLSGVIVPFIRAAFTCPQYVKVESPVELMG